MSYYGARGDFYTGRTGYYRGDPGFFSSLGGLVKTGITAVANYYTGGAASAILGGGSSTPTMGIVSSAPNRAAMAAPRASSSRVVSTSVPRARGRLAPPSMPSMGGPLVSRGAAAAAATTRGSYAGGRRHRMNVCNPRALRRAIRRTHGFAKLAMKTIHIVHPKKRATFGGFRRKRRK
jgi:hypothetical protein